MNEFEQRWRDLGEFIREQRSIGHLSLRKLSEMAGISNPYLSQIERGLRKPSAEILRQIASALQISAETLYVRAGILDEPGGPTDLVAEIRRVADLDEEQKRALVQIYETFRREAAAKAESEIDESASAEAPVADVSDDTSDEDEESAGAARR